MQNSDPSLAIQRAIVERLRGRTDAADSVFDAVPKDTIFPRIVIGASTVSPLRLDCIDGSETVIDLHIWSRGVGQVEVKRIAGAVRSLLDDADLVLDGHICDQIIFDGTRIVPGAEPNTARAIVTFRITTQPE